MRKIGCFSEKVIHTLNLDIDVGTPIYIGDTNIEHIISRHPYEYDKYYEDIEYILAEPDFVGINPKDQSIGFVKLYKISDEYIRVAVRVTASNMFFVKTLHLLSTYNAERYIERNTLKALT